jgi:hypothetical protein
LQFKQGRKDRIEIAVGAGLQDMEPEPEIAGRRLRTSCLGLGSSAVYQDRQAKGEVACFYSGLVSFPRRAPFWPISNTGAGFEDGHYERGY